VQTKRQAKPQATPESCFRAAQDEGAVLRALEWLSGHVQQSSVEVMDYLRRLISPQIAH
jgi:hypothetical protein